MVTGFWAAGEEGTVTQMNQTLLQKGAEGDFSVSEIGLTFFETSSGKIKRSNGTAWNEIIAVDAAAGTAALRTLGTGATTAAAGNHTHTANDDRKGGGTQSASEATAGSIGQTFTCAQDNTIDIISLSISPTIGALIGGAVSCHADARTRNDTSVTAELELLIDGTEVASVTILGGVDTSTSTDILYNLRGTRAVSSGTRVIKMQLHCSGGSGGGTIKGTYFVNAFAMTCP